ncbi:hypothetical protein ACFZBU_36190 [Embleya sp. NPDC008237]|uniref:hypothetical protein n=1 Tax=Embleya sp. NPDC008237 TaxID=3363978 RepID=UPI0036F10817
MTGSELHVRADGEGMPLVVGLSGGNTYDNLGPKPPVEALLSKHDPHQGRSWKPDRLHADKAYDIPDLRGMER